MAAFDYLETAQDALDALVECGAIATVTSTPAAASDDYDPATSTGTPAAPVTVSAYAAVFDFASHKYGNHAEALVRVGDRQLLFAALDVNGAAVPESKLPIDAQVVGPDGAKYIIKNVFPIAPAGTAVLFDILVRRPAG